MEVRAIFAALPESFANDFDGKKMAWRSDVQAKLLQMTTAEAAGTLPRSSVRHQAYAGMPVGPFDASLPLVRKEAVASTAFSKVELPAETGGGVVSRTAAALLADSGWVTPARFVEGAAEGAVARTVDVLKDRLVFSSSAVSPLVFQTPDVASESPSVGSEKRSRKPLRPKKKRSNRFDDAVHVADI